MSRKLKQFALANAPLAGNDIATLTNNFHAAFGADNVANSLVMFIVDNPRRMVFAKVKPNGQPDLTAQTVSFELPCPPYCGTRGVGAPDISVLTTT